MNQNNMTSLLTLLIGKYNDEDDDGEKPRQEDDDDDDEKSRQDDLNECSSRSHRHDDDRRQLHRLWRRLHYAGKENKFSDP